MSSTKIGFPSTYQHGISICASVEPVSSWSPGFIRSLVPSGAQVGPHKPFSPTFVVGLADVAGLAPPPRPGGVDLHWEAFRLPLPTSYGSLPGFASRPVRAGSWLYRLMRARFELERSESTFRLLDGLLMGDLPPKRQIAGKIADFQGKQCPLRAITLFFDPRGR